MAVLETQKNFTNNLSIQVNGSDSDAFEKLPRYLQLADIIKNEIVTKYKADDFLPSENQLAESFGVNRHTIRRALDELVTHGLIMRHQGKGSQVLSKNKLKYELNIGRFTTSINKQNRSNRAEVVLTEYVKPSGEQCKVFDIQKSVDLILIQTLRFVDDEPMSLISHYLNPTFVVDIDKYYQSGSLHGLIKQQYGHELTRREAMISARLPLKAESEHLQCHHAQPLLIIQSVNCVAQANGKPDVSKVVEMSVSVSRADRMKINVDY